MSGKSKIFLVIGLIYIAGIFYKIFTCPSCTDDYFGFEVPAIADFIIKAFFAYVLIKPFYIERQKAKAQNH